MEESIFTKQRSLTYLEQVIRFGNMHASLKPYMIGKLTLFRLNKTWNQCYNVNCTSLFVMRPAAKLFVSVSEWTYIAVTFYWLNNQCVPCLDLLVWHVSLDSLILAPISSCFLFRLERVIHSVQNLNRILFT